MGMLLLDNLYHMPATRRLVLLYFVCAFFSPLLLFWHEKGTMCPDWQSAHAGGCAWPNWSLQEYFCYWVTLALCTSGCFSSGNGFESKQAGFCNKPVKRQPSFYPHMSTDKNACGQAVIPITVFHLHRAVFSQWKSDTTVYFLVNLFFVPLLPFSFFSCCLVLISFFFFFLSGLFSVQQCPSEHEDPAAKPDGIDGELGTPSDSLPPTYHQLHGLLQLGETWCRWWKDLHQDRGSEHGECGCLKAFIYFFYNKCCINSSDWCAEPQMYLSGSEVGQISDGVYWRWQVMMNSACGCWLIWGPRHSAVTHLSKNRSTGPSQTLTCHTEILYI